MSKINTKVDINSTLISFIRKGIITETQRPDIEIEIENIFNIKGVENMFINFDELKNERSILLPNGESYQPDRVMVKDNKTIIIDYKTGDRKSYHSSQLNDYESILKQMNLIVTHKILVYINDTIDVIEV